MKNVTFIFSTTVLIQFVRIFILANVACTFCFAQNDSSQVRTVATTKDFSFQPVSPLCYGASAQQAIFFENFESGLGQWAVFNYGYPPQNDANLWKPRDWVVTDSIPAGRTGKAAFAVNPTSEECADMHSGQGIMRLTSPAITIPETVQGVLLMAFDHFFDLKSNVDGGNLKYQIGNGEWSLVPASVFTDNGYVMKIDYNETSRNFLFGQPVFTNPDQESNGSGWGQSRIDLSALGLKAGQTLRLRWEMGTDEGCEGRQGWYIDNVRIYTCSVAPTVQFALDSTIVGEGEAGTARPVPDACLRYAEKTIKVKINAAPSQPVTITLTTDGTATRGATADYTITPASFTLQEGKLSQDVKVRINNDSYVEGNETISLGYTLSSPAGGNAFREYNNQQHTVLIEDDDFTPGIRNTILFSEQFNEHWLEQNPDRNFLPKGWTAVNPTGTSSDWRVYYALTLYTMQDFSPFLFANWEFDPGNASDKIIESPSFDSFGMSAINLSYDETFYQGQNSWGKVDVWDGTQWHNVLTQIASTNPDYPYYDSTIRNIYIPAAYANRAMKIRFWLTPSRGAWAIDNVKVTGTVVSDAATAVTSDVQQLGPNATAYFYDPVSEKLMARIKNLTSHDYGCTTMSIDRAGTDETDWFDTFYHITKKTFKVTPSSDDPNGLYELTLYYKNSELPNFNGTDIKSIGQSPGGINTDNLPSTSVAETVSSSPLNLSFGFSAVFHNGFLGTSGFGLSDAPPLRPAAIRLNSAGPAFEASDGRRFSVDQYYYSSNNRNSVIANVDILNTEDDGLYLNQRYGSSFSYSIPVSNGPMKVILHFAETYWGVPGRGGAAGTGKRQFHVNMEADRKLTDYDIFTRTGGALRAKTETFAVDVSDGTLNIDFLSGAADNPIIAAIEVLPTQLILDPVADATVRNVPNDSVNYGTAGTLEIKAGSLPSYQRKMYLKFPLTGIAQVGSAKLQLYGSNIQNITDVIMAAYGVDNDDWSETGITWANAPASSGNAVGQVSVNKTLKYYEIDVTSYVKSQLSGDGIVSFLLANPGNQNSQLSFNSRENVISKQPQLVIRSAPPAAARIGLSEEVVIMEPGASKVYPNPASKQLMVEVSARHQGKVSLQLTSLSGRTYPLATVGDKAVVQTDLSPLNLPAGIYILGIHSAALEEAVKLMVTE